MNMKAVGNKQKQKLRDFLFIVAEIIYLFI